MSRTLQMFLPLVAVVALAGIFARPAEAKIKVVWIKTYEVVLAEDIIPGIASSSPEQLTAYQGALYFSADDGVHGRELWKYDGNTASLVADIFPGQESSDAGNFAIYDGDLYFSANDGVHGMELWKYDGNAASLVADILPGPEWSMTGGWSIMKFKGALYFAAWDGVHGLELWKYDGSASQVADLFPGSDSSFPMHLTVFDDALYFFGSESTSGRDLWKYDGSKLALVADVSEPEEIFDLYADGSLIEFNDELYLMQTGSKCEVLCKLDGSPPPVHVDISPAEFPSDPAIFETAIYFCGSEDVHGSELWKYDGNTATLAMDLLPGPAGAWPQHLTVYNGELFFIADDGIRGRELFRGSSFAKDIDPGSSGSDPEWLTVFDRALYFAAREDAHGRELWRFRFTGRLPKIYADQTRPLQKWWEWPIETTVPVDRFAGTFGLLALAKDAAPRLLARHRVRLGAAKTPLYESPLLDSQSLPQTIALASVILHDASGRTVVSETEVVTFEGEPDPQVRELLERQARTLLENLTLEELRAMEIGEFAVADQGVEPRQGSQLPLLIIISLAILTAILVVSMALMKAKTK